MTILKLIDERLFDLLSITMNLIIEFNPNCKERIKKLRRYDMWGFSILGNIRFLLFSVVLLCRDGLVSAGLKIIFKRSFLTFIGCRPCCWLKILLRSTLH